MSANPTTIHDLARQLKVSSTTVWRALNDSPRVSAKTREKILLAAKKMHYRPSLVAQTLFRGRSQTLGIVVPMIGNPVYASLVRAVEQVAFERKYSLILCDTDFALDREREYVDLLSRRRVEGIIMIPFAARTWNQADYAHLTGLAEQGIQLVLMQQSVPLEMDMIVPDNHQAARAMTHHLLSLGHRRIGFLHGGMPAWNTPMIERFSGYKRALLEVGIEFDESLVLQVGSFESVLTDDAGFFWPDKVCEFLQRNDRPTAIFAPVDVLAIKVMDVITHQMHLRVPEDVSVAGFDDIFMSSHTSPPLTTVQHPSHRVGRRAAELLFDRLETSETKIAPRKVHEKILCELVLRRSCAAPQV